MNTFGVHVRDTIRLDQAFINSLPTLSAGVPMTFVARSITLAGATINNRSVTIIAQELHMLAGPAPADSLKLVNTSTAANGVAGAPGFALNVFCRDLFACGATSRGGKGGRGAQGAQGAPLPPPPTNPEDDGPIIKPLPGEQGNPGKVGKQGFPGGAGGAINVRFVTDKSAGKTNFVSAGGPGGNGGPGGPGGPGGSGRPPGDPGPPGPTGPAGVTGPAGPVSGAAITASTFRSELIARNLQVPWARFRARQAEFHFRSGALSAARAEANEVLAIIPGDTEAEALLRLIREHRTLLGCERDPDVDLDADLHARAHRNAARDVDDALFDAGDVFFGAPTAPRLEAAAIALRGALQAMLSPEGVLQEQSDAQAQRLERAVAIRDEATRLMGEQRGRIAQLVPAGAQVQGINALALADAIARVLGAEAGTVGTLLPAAPDILVDTKRAAEGGPFVAGSFETNAVVQSALGLVAPPGWAGIGTPGSNVAVNLRRVADELRAATGDATAKALLAELTEIAHRWRLANLRVSQAVGAVSSLAVLRSRTQAARTALPTTAAPLPAAMMNVLVGVRRLLDGHAWRTLLAERSVALYTLGLGFDPSDTGNQSLSTSQALLSRPELEDDIREGHAQPSLQFFDEVLKAVGLRSMRSEVSRYEARGGAVRFDQPGELVAVTRRFTRATHPQVFARLAQDGSCWIEVGLGDFRPVHSEAKLAGAEVSLGGVQTSSSSFAVTLTHGGIARQRVLGTGAVRDQTLLPAALTIPVTRTAPGFHTGRVAANEDDPGTLAPYGRAAAAAYRLEIDPAALDLATLETLEVKLLCQAFSPLATVTLRQVDHPPVAVRAGAKAHATITLTAPAPAGGTKLTLASSDPLTVRVAPDVTVAAGETSAAVALEALKVSGPVPPQLSVTAPDGTVRRAFVGVGPPLGVVTRVIEPGAVGALAIAGERLFAGFAPAGKGAPPSLHALRLDLARGPAAPQSAPPRGVAVDRGHAFVARGAGVATLDVSEPLLAGLVADGEAALGAETRDVAVNPADGRVYVAGTNVEVLDPDGVKLTTLPGVTSPRGLTFAGDTVLVLHGTSLSSIRHRTDGTYQLVKTVELPFAGPVDVTTNGNATLVAVACTGGVVTFTRPTLLLRNRTPLPAPARAIAGHRGIAYVVSDAGLHLVDIASGRLGATLPAGAKPSSVAVDPRTGAAYVGDAVSGTVSRIECPQELAPQLWG